MRNILISNIRKFNRFIFLLFITAILVAQFAIPVVPAQALAPKAPNPGSTFETASGLGLTSWPSTQKVGIQLKPTMKTGYYFTFTLEKTTDLNFQFLTSYSITSEKVILAVYDSRRRAINQLNGSKCYKSVCQLALKSRTAGTYYLWLNFISNTRAASTSDGWLTWSLKDYTGKNVASALPLSKAKTLYGQANLGESHYYKLKTAGLKSVSLRLLGASYSTLGMAVTSNLSPTKAIASTPAKSSYPITLVVTIPTGTTEIYIKIDNQKATT